MSFKLKDSTKPVPTHLKFIAANPSQAGIERDINLILVNQDWRTLTFFCKDFKYNLKSASDEDFCVSRDNLYKSLKRGYAVAKIKDTSDLSKPEYSVEIEIDSVPESKGGRKYSLGKNRINFEESKAEDTEEQTS